MRKNFIGIGITVAVAIAGTIVATVTGGDPMTLAAFVKPLPKM